VNPRRLGTCNGGDAGRQDHRAWFVVIEPNANVHACGDRLEGLKNRLNYGADRIGDLSPVPAGLRLPGRASIAEAEDVPPNGLRVHYHVMIEKAVSPRPALPG
jgi:hypothetical protein